MTVTYLPPTFFTGLGTPVITRGSPTIFGLPWVSITLHHNGFDFSTRDRVQIPILPHTVPADVNAWAFAVSASSTGSSPRLVVGIQSDAPEGTWTLEAVVHPTEGNTLYSGVFEPRDLSDTSLFNYSGVGEASIADLMRRDLPRGLIYLYLLDNGFIGQGSETVYELDVWGGVIGADPPPPPPPTLPPPARISGRMDGRGPLGSAPRLDTADPACRGSLSFRLGSAGSYDGLG